MVTSYLPVLLVALLLVTITVLVALRVRGTPLEDFHLGPAESVLFEADQLTVRLGFRSEVTVQDAFVRVTNRRMLIGTGSPSEPRRARVQFVALLDGYGFGKGVIDEGFATFPVKRTEIVLDDGVVQLRPLGAGFEVPNSVEIVCEEAKRAGTLRAALDGRTRSAGRTAG